MRVIIAERLGGPEVLSVAEREAPRPGPGQVVVEVAAAGVNFADIYQREGVGGYRQELPFVPGMEGAGTVIAVADGVTALAVGDRVTWTGGPAAPAATRSRWRCPPTAPFRCPRRSACRSRRP